MSAPKATALAIGGSVLLMVSIVGGLLGYAIGWWGLLITVPLASIMGTVAGFLIVETTDRYKDPR